nr:HAD family phosphatase [Brevibacterium sp. XM4083]
MGGAIFDCDGILVDSERPWLDLMAAYLDRLGVNDDRAESFRGLSGAEAAEQLAAVATGVGTAPTATEIDSAYTAALAEVSAPMPGARQLVRALAGVVPIAVASNGRSADVRGLLDRAGLLDCFDAIVTIDDVDDGKPSPDVYLRAAHDLGLDPRVAVAFEDSPVGSQAAAAAGCTVVGINADRGIPLVADVRLTEMSDVHVDPTTRMLRISVDG